MYGEIFNQVEGVLTTKESVGNYISNNLKSIDLRSLLKMSSILTPQKRSNLVKIKIKSYLLTDEVVVIRNTPYIRQFYPNKKLTHITVVVVKNDNCEIYRLNYKQLMEEYNSLDYKSINRISVKYGESVSIQPSNIRDWDKYKLPNMF